MNFSPLILTATFSSRFKRYLKPRNLSSLRQPSGIPEPEATLTSKSKDIVTANLNDAMVIENDVEILNPLRAAKVKLDWTLR